MPLGQMVRRHGIELLASIGLFAAVTGPNYVNTVYMPSLAVAKHGIAQSEAMLAVVLAAMVMAVLIPVFGWLADKMSRINLAIAGMVCTAAIYGVLFTSYMAEPSASSFLWLLLGCAVAYAALVGASCTLAMEHFPVLVRATGGATGYNLATMIFGGMCPFWLALLDRAGGTYAPMIYIIVTMGIGVSGAILLGRQSENRRRNAPVRDGASAHGGAKR
jgi:MFS family permease